MNLADLEANDDCAIAKFRAKKTLNADNGEGIDFLEGGSNINQTLEMTQGNYDTNQGLNITTTYGIKQYLNSSSDSIIKEAKIKLILADAVKLNSQYKTLYEGLRLNTDSLSAVT